MRGIADFIMVVLGIVFAVAVIAVTSPVFWMGVIGVCLVRIAF